MSMYKTPAIMHEKRATHANSAIWYTISEINKPA